MADRVIVVALLVTGVNHLASAQQTAVGFPNGNAPIAFVNVNLIPMDGERVEAGHTVLVRGDRIISVGTRAEVPIPDNATVIDGGGGYLLPGLTDSHVHLVGDGTGFGVARPDFGDGPLYLAYSVTTVLNLRGTAVQLEWRRRIAKGDRRCDGDARGRDLRDVA